MNVSATHDAYKTIVFGENATLQSVGVRYLNPVVEWRKDDQPIDNITNGRYFVTKGGELKILDVQFKNSGHYVWTVTSHTPFLRSHQLIMVTVRDKKLNLTVIQVVLASHTYCHLQVLQLHHKQSLSPSTRH